MIFISSKTFSFQEKIFIFINKGFYYNIRTFTNKKYYNFKKFRKHSFLPLA